MHFPTYPITRPQFALRFWPEKSDGACLSTAGKPLMFKATDTKGNEIMRPVNFTNSNTNHIRFASKRKCLQWLQKVGQFGIVQSDMLLIHPKC